MRTRVQAELREFKEQLTVLLVGLLFVLLAADVRVAQVVSLGWPGALTVLALMLLVRPADVAVSTAGSDLTVNEKLFLSWIAPRGIVAAAIASLFARRLVEEGIPGGDELLALVFLVIAATVVLQGGTAGLVASALGVRRPQQGWAILGANALGRALAWSLERGDEAVVMVDRNAAEAQAAQKDGHHVVYGDASQERTLLQAAIESRRGILGVTPSDGMNPPSRPAGGRHDTRADLVRRDRQTNRDRHPAAQVSDAGSRILFGREGGHRGVDPPVSARQRLRGALEAGGRRTQAKRGTPGPEAAGTSAGAGAGRQDATRGRAIGGEDGRRALSGSAGRRRGGASPPP